MGFVSEIFRETFGIEPIFGANPSSNGNQYLQALTVVRDQVYRGNDTLAKGALLGQILYEAVENASTSRIPSAARSLLLDAADGQVTLGRALTIIEPNEGLEMDEHIVWSAGSDSMVPMLIGHDNDHQFWII